VAASAQDRDPARGHRLVQHPAIGQRGVSTSDLARTTRSPTLGEYGRGP
jgi:hypothetical protein